MPAFDIEVDGTKILTVSTDGLDGLWITVSGSRTEPEFAFFDVGGSSSVKGEGSAYRGWVPNFSLRAGQNVRVVFLETGESSWPGKTIDELHPDEPPVEEMDFTVTAEEWEALRARPKLRDKYVLGFTTPSGAVVRAETSSQEDGFSLSLLWAYFEPERVWASLSTSSFEMPESGIKSNYVFREKLVRGASVSLQIT